MCRTGTKALRRLWNKTYKGLACVLVGPSRTQESAFLSRTPDAGGPWATHGGTSGRPFLGQAGLCVGWGQGKWSMPCLMLGGGSLSQLLRPALLPQAAPTVNSAAVRWPGRPGLLFSVGLRSLRLLRRLLFPGSPSAAACPGDPGLYPLPLLQLPAGGHPPTLTTRGCCARPCLVAGATETGGSSDPKAGCAQRPSHVRAPGLTPLNLSPHPFFTLPLSLESHRSGDLGPG